jgi:hypothetical protein
VREQRRVICSEGRGREGREGRRRRGGRSNVNRPNNVRQLEPATHPTGKVDMVQADRWICGPHAFEVSAGVASGVVWRGRL